MIYGDLQFFDILIFAAIAGFIIYRLRSVLGKRTGFQKNISEPKPQETKKQEDVQKIPSLMDNETKLEAEHIKAKENFKIESFNLEEIIQKTGIFILYEKKRKCQEECGKQNESECKKRCEDQISDQILGLFKY